MTFLKPTVESLTDRIFCEATGRGMSVELRTLKCRDGRWPIMRVDDARRAGSPILLLTAGIHGEEIAGPMTIQHRFREIADAAEAAGLRLVCYPLMNPSGFELGKRYDADVIDEASYEGNNDYLRYRTFDGRWIWDLCDARQMSEWRWSSDPALAIDLPAETRAMHEWLKHEDWANVAVAVDLHQDYLSPVGGPGAYHYAFGDLARYRSIVAGVASIVPVLVARSFGVQPGHPEGVATTDADGFIVRHDGSLSDLCHRLGVPYAVTVETTGETPIEKAIEVNLEWIRGLCRLVAP